MRFYTNVQLIGNQFLVRGVENGKRYEHRDEFFPTLYVKSKKKSKYKTLNGETVEPINPGTVRDCREFYKKYDDIEGFDIYGNDRYIYQYISEKYPEDEIKFDIARLNLLLWILRLRLSKGSLMLNRASKRYLQSQSKIIQLSKLLLGELNLLITNKIMLPTTAVTLRKNFFDHS